ncbi:carbohydrate sulfotransferase 3-like isoform X2 [Physella acuta]|uniref:carbohydrate sulfotransferase 3-like isoform X2 n=1 Tax=Physella acuta TaxID=109671 RepID=UPI0027DD962C|nr:carbohydrate sulfotransferase 3-like isoform X2 [Physella acuta]
MSWTRACCNTMSRLTKLKRCTYLIILLTAWILIVLYIQNNTVFTWRIERPPDIKERDLDTDASSTQPRLDLRQEPNSETVPDAEEGQHPYDQNLNKKPDSPHKASGLDQNSLEYIFQDSLTHKEFHDVEHFSLAYIQPNQSSTTATASKHLENINQLVEQLDRAKFWMNKNKTLSEPQHKAADQTGPLTEPQHKAADQTVPKHKPFPAARAKRPAATATKKTSHFNVFMDKWQKWMDEKEYFKATNQRTASTTNQKLVIMTYMRSGSSFTGDLFQQNPEVFYVYEPLWFTERIQSSNVTDKKFYFLNSINNALNTGEFYSQRRLQVMQDVLNCRLENLDIGTLKQYHMFSSVSTFGYALCAYNASKPTKSMIYDLTKQEFEKLRECLGGIRTECHQTNYLVVKVIRLTMLELGQLMDLDPDFKVLYLVRDPRGTVKSQYQVGMFNWTTLMNYSKGFCQKVADDIRVYHELYTKYPGRMLNVRYEDIVEQPLQKTKELYSFLQLKFTPYIQEYIWNITYAGNQDDCNICTTRKNAKETAYAWRKRLSYAAVNAIQSQCSDVMQHFGYRPLKPQELLDFDISSSFVDLGGQRIFK